MLAKAKNSIRGLLHRHSPSIIKRHVWNREFANGKWDCLDSMPDDCVIPHVEKIGGEILDLGCGPGAIASSLKSYKSYLGVDISDFAIAKANSRGLRAEFVQGDMLTFEPEKTYDLILFGDSIYYCSMPKVGEILKRYSGFLKPHGVFIMRSWILGDRAKNIVSLIESEFSVLERHWYLENKMLVITFR